MGLIARTSFAAGWTPDADAAGAPPGALLRADNLTLDEIGVVALRQDSRQIYTLLDGDVHSLATEYLNGTRFRFAGAGDLVYVNGTRLVGPLAGVGDIYFGSYLGQIFFARGASRLKYDGAAVSNWGIAMTGGAPTVTPGLPDGKSFFIGTEPTGSWVYDQDDGDGFAQGDNHANVGNAAIVIKPTTATGRSSLTFKFANPTDFTAYDDLTDGEDSDLISIYVFLTEPANLAELDLLIDVNDGTFQTDYYRAEFTPQSAQTVSATADGPTSADFGTPPSSPTPINAQVPGDQVAILANVGWNQIQIGRGQMARVGSTNLKDWTTVKAVRLATTGYSNDEIRYDTLRISGARLNGQYQHLYVLVRNTGSYEILSAPSAPSDPVTISSTGALLTIPADALRDTQCTEVWVFRNGGFLPGYFRTAVKTIKNAGLLPTIFSFNQPWEEEFLTHLSVSFDNGVANYVSDFEDNFAADPSAVLIDPDTQYGQGVYTNTFELTDGDVLKIGMPTTRTATGSIAIDDTLSDKNALIVNIPLQSDNLPPPQTIVGIEGPYFDRLFALTSDGFLWPSRQINPDSFAAGQAIRVCGAEETPYWVKKGIGGLYIGTSKDIYRLEGDGTELPDGSINFIKRSLNVDHPPITDGLAQEGNLLVYMADDGWRAFTGEATQSITGHTSLLYRGYTRHGVSPVNLATGRFRAAINRGQFVAVTPEGAAAASSPVLYRQAPQRSAWYRHVYGVNFRSVYRERDGTLVAGDTTGGYWQLDTPNVNSLPVVLWTPADDGGSPFERKTASGLHLTMDTGGASVTALLLVDGGLAGGSSFTVGSQGLNLTVLDASGVKDFRQAQIQIAGACVVFRFGGYAITAVPRPTGVKTWDTGPVDLSGGELVWLRRVFLKVKPSAPLTLSVYVDGANVKTVTVPVNAGNDTQVPIDLPKGVVGKQARLVITSAGEFLPYWAQVQLRATGKGSEKPLVTVSAA